MKYLILIISLFSLSFLGFSEASRRLPGFLRLGQCSLRANPMQQFDRNRFSGRWFKIGGMKNPDEEKAVKCATMDFGLSDVGMVMKSHGVDTKGRPTNPQSSVQTMKMSSPNVGGFTFKYGSRRTLSMDVIATDYDSYACMISCDNVASHHALFAWILNRKPDFNRNVVSSCQLAMKKAGIPVSKLRGTPQGGDCTYPN